MENKDSTGTQKIQCNVNWDGTLSHSEQNQNCWESLIPPKVQVWEDFRKKAQMAEIRRKSKLSKGAKVSLGRRTNLLMGIIA